jgi:very-short-patch-repair endonuclease
MGDSKQLPPTDFFDTVVSFPEHEPDEYITAGEMESILNVCKRSFPVKTLRWHYRSKHESLIAISNQEFYGNRLYIYPSPMQEDEKLGLKFVHLQDAVYDRGKSGVNRIEARTVAKAVFEHFNKFPDKSLGIGTFNVKQQEAIQEEIEALLKTNPGFDLNPKNERSEHFFVKNLETIQGDERDVIFLSVGFGFDENRKLSLNFGPLNHEGGERRLNVIITRAREKCVVFANFTSRDLNLDENPAFGLKALKIFLEFAESGKLPLPACSREAFDSPFEEAVSNFLAENGCEVHRQIGCAGYRLDLAIPDPSIPGRYVLGIECDGHAYYSSRVSRDRDRLRQQVLEGLGWKIYRIWSTDWYLHPKESKESLLGAVNEVIKQAKIQAKSKPEAPVLEIREPASWAKSANKSSVGKASDSLLYSVSSDDTANMDKMEGTKNTDDSESIKGEFDKKIEIESFETENSPEIFFETDDEESYSGEFVIPEERIGIPLGSDFLPEMTLKAGSLASLADENSRKPSARKTGKSKLLKFNMDSRSGKDSPELISEPEPEKISFYQAYPEIDFSESLEKKRKSKRINEFAYIYGTGTHFDPEPDFEEEDDTSTKWNSEPEIESEPEFEPQSGIEFPKEDSKKEEEKLSKKRDPLEVNVPLYRACPSSGISISKDLSEIPDEKLEEAVIRIVECEGPIHSEALIQRIKSDAEIHRMLGKIKQRISDAVEHAECSGKIRIISDFYWQTSEPVCLLRRREGDEAARIEWICDEEIKEAIRFVLNNQYSTPLQDLITQTSRVLGIKTTRKNVWERIEKLVQASIENNELTVTPNETIYFAE